MIKTKITTDKLLEIIKSLPENKCKLLYDFALFLSWQSKDVTDNTAFSLTNKQITNSEKKLTMNDINECFGIWEGREISKESLRKKAWRNGK